MNSDKFDALLSTLPNLQNLDFHLTKVPNDKINRKEEKEMERTFRLRKASTFHCIKRTKRRKKKS